MIAKRTIELVVNGKQCEGFVEARLSLADFLRDYLGLSGTHLGCEQGICGSCTVLFNGQTVRTCLLLAVQANGVAQREVLSHRSRDTRALERKSLPLYRLSEYCCRRPVGGGASAENKLTYS